MSKGDLDKSFNNAKRWREEALALRKILLQCDLKEEKKWGKPCYTYDGKNIAIIQRMKDFLALLYFKGVFLKDEDGVLEPQGPNSRAGFRMRFTNVSEVNQSATCIKTYIREAIEIEKAGLKLEKPRDIDLPQELIDSFEEDPELHEAFTALTPGRQRGYNLYFSAPKQSKTRATRIEKYRDKICSGKGMNDR